jgi:uncharacterized protein
MHRNVGEDAVYEAETNFYLEQLPEEECLELLERHNLGRLAVIVDGRPLIFPVNYALSHRVVTFRTGHGTKLSSAPGSYVAFEIDEYEPSTGVGWSVLVQGEAVDATTAIDDVSWTARGANPRPLPPGEKLHRLAIKSDLITGRRFKVDR